MQFTNVEQAKEFLKIVETCISDVWLESKYGDSFNLKSKLAKYVALDELLTSRGEDLELFCSKKEDESKFFEFFNKHPETI